AAKSTGRHVPSPGSSHLKCPFAVLRIDAKHPPTIKERDPQLPFSVDGHAIGGPLSAGQFNTDTAVCEGARVSVDVESEHLISGRINVVKRFSVRAPAQSIGARDGADLGARREILIHAIENGFSRRFCAFGHGAHPKSPGRIALAVVETTFGPAASRIIQMAQTCGRRVEYGETRT